MSLARMRAEDEFRRAEHGELDFRDIGKQAARALRDARMDDDGRKLARDVAGGWLTPQMAARELERRSDDADRERNEP